MKFRVINRFRFITFLVIVFLLLSFIFLSFLNFSSARDVKSKTYISVEVMPGDTLWQIAKDFGPADMDVREIIYNISKLNNVTADTLKAGQILLIPTN